jgi:phosphatidate cytidylyltransferase
VCAALGDLVESALKRAARVKDSGDLIPGRGGLLDSIDSMLFCGPVFFLWMQTVDWTPVS